MNLFNFPLHLAANINAGRKIAHLNKAPMQKRAINILNVFRFLLSVIFIFSYLYLDKEQIWLNQYLALFSKLSIAYFLFSTSILLISPFKSAPYALPAQIWRILSLLFYSCLQPVV